MRYILVFLVLLFAFIGWQQYKHLNDQRYRIVCHGNLQELKVVSSFDGEYFGSEHHAVVDSQEFVLLDDKDWSGNEDLHQYQQEVVVFELLPWSDDQKSDRKSQFVLGSSERINKNKLDERAANGLKLFICLSLMSLVIMILSWKEDS